LRAVPFEQLVGGTTYSMAGIRGVTCAIHMRRRGIVDRLFRHVLHELRPRYDLSTLYPFSPPFYERYDYGICGHPVSWRLRLEDLDLPLPDSSPRPLSKDDVPAIRRLTERELMEVGNGALRIDDYWIERYYFPRTDKDTDPITLGWFDRAGELEAVISWRPQAGGGTWDKNRIAVRFYHGVDLHRQRQALGFLRTLKDQYFEVIIDRPADDLFYHDIRKPYHWDSTIMRAGYPERSTNYDPEWEARLLDPARALTVPRQLHGPGGTLVVELSDTVFADLNGHFHWQLDAMNPGWEPLPAGSVPAELPRMKLSMGDLSRIWYGAVDVHQLARAGRVEIDEPAATILHAACGGFRCHMQLHF